MMGQSRGSDISPGELLLCCVGHHTVQVILYIRDHGGLHFLTIAHLIISSWCLQ